MEGEDPPAGDNDIYGIQLGDNETRRNYGRLIIFSPY